MPLFFFQWYWMEGGKKEFCQPALDLDFEYKNNKIVGGEISIDLNEAIKLEKLLTSRIESESNYLQYFVDNCYRLSSQLLKTSRIFSKVKNLNKLSNRDLSSFYLEYQNSVLSLIPFLNVILVVDNILKKLIEEHLKTDLKIRGKKEQDLIISQLVIPKKKSFFVKETETLLKIALKLQENPKANISREINDYLKKFSWMSSISYIGEFQKKQDVIQKLKRLVKENPKKKISEAKLIKQKTIADYKKTFKRIEKSKKLVELVDYAREFIYLQTYRLDVFFLAHYYAYPLLKEIGKRSNLKVEELVYLTGDEIINLINNKITITKNEVKSRIKNYALILENEKYTLLSGNKVKIAVHRAVKEIEVKGVVVSRGRTTGKAKLVEEVADISKVNRGDIIISSMTRPELVPAIVKASGIITDFGGMLCHAAIISREFGIACIVGTKQATKVFKDNDLVELNAYEGIARKII